jgi:hypothetical protein
LIRKYNCEIDVPRLREIVAFCDESPEGVAVFVVW